jgi:hypothetical protein
MFTKDTDEEMHRAMCERRLELPYTLWDTTFQESPCGQLSASSLTLYF